PKFLPLDNAGLAATALGWLVLILYFPGGIAQMVKPLRDRIIDLVARAEGLDPVAIRNDEAVDDPDSVQVCGGLAITRSIERKPVEAGVPLLQVQDVKRYFGGVKAVDGVSFEVRPGEIVGLIGPNGAARRRCSSWSAASPRSTPARSASTARTSRRWGPRSAAS